TGFQPAVVSQRMARRLPHRSARRAVSNRRRGQARGFWPSRPSAWSAPAADSLARCRANCRISELEPHVGEGADADLGDAMQAVEDVEIGDWDVDTRASRALPLRLDLGHGLHVVDARPRAGHLRGADPEAGS